VEPEEAPEPIEAGSLAPVQPEASDPPATPTLTLVYDRDRTPNENE